MCLFSTFKRAPKTKKYKITYLEFQIYLKHEYGDLIENVVNHNLCTKK